MRYRYFRVNSYNNDGLLKYSLLEMTGMNFQVLMGSIGIKDDGTMWSFGKNSNGLAGVGSDEYWINEITQIGTDTDWKHINLNGPTALAIKTDKSLWSWGNGWAGQLGNGTYGNSNEPVLVSGGIQWETTGGGWNFQTALATDLTIYGWGYNRAGNLGGLGKVDSQYLDWTTDASIIDGGFILSDLGYVIIQDTSLIDYESANNSPQIGKGK